MLQPMGKAVGQHGVIERRHVPGPQRHGVQHRRDERIGEEAPGCREPPCPADAADRPAPARRQRPHHRPAGPRQHEERRRDDHEQLVLDHVGGEEVLAEPVQRRHERERERGPAEPEARRLGVADAAPVPGPAPEAEGADEVKERRAVERHDDAKIVGPGDIDRCVSARAVVRRGRAGREHQREGEKRRHRSHPFSTRPAAPWVRMTSANRTPSRVPMTPRNGRGASRRPA